MNVEGDGAGPSRTFGTGWLVALTLTLCVIGVGAWYGWRSFGSSNVAEISIEDYLRIKSTLDEVRIEGEDLYGNMSKGWYVVNGAAYKRVHAVIPQAYLIDPQRFAELKSGVDPARLQISPRR